MIERLQELADARGESLSAAVTAAGITKGNITYWKTGKIPTGEALIKLSNYFGVTTDYLLGREDASLSPERQELVDLAQTLSDDKVAALLAVAKTIQ